MSEITPNTPNPVREDAYVEELAEKLGIDPQFIPKSPVWRNEEEIKAIAEMFSNMSGGGSSGGGVMKIGVNMTESGGKDIFTLDKTWKQISDAIDAGEVPYCVFADGSYSYVTIVSTVYQDDEEGFVVSNRMADYTTNSENGYPSYTEGGSNY